MKKIFLLSLIALFLGGCTYKFVEPEVGDPIDPNDTISFQTQVIPIFETGNGNCISCHKPGATSPDLTAPNAYDEIISKGLVDNSDAAASTIYYYPAPDNTSDHGWNQYSTSEAEIVLLWVTQGAQNN